MKTEQNELGPTPEKHELDGQSSELLDQLESRLEQINFETKDPLERMQLAQETISQTTAQLKALLLSYPELGEQDEINFFKHIKPRFYRWEIYYEGIYTIENSIPIAQAEAQIAYFRKEIEYIERFRQQYLFQYEYYKLGATELDSYYFMRAVATRSNIMPTVQEPDGHFSTCLDYLVSKFMAFDMIRSWLIDKVTYLMKNPEASYPSDQQNANKRWTDNKVDLIELAYAIHARGSIDRGKADVKQVIGLLEQAFNIDLGNYYGVFTQNIRLRKKNRTVFIDQLKENLERRMTELDE